MSRYCQEEWARRMVRLHVLRGDRLKVALLSGDAGCGKSYAIAVLASKLEAMKVSVAVSAMTNKAAGSLMESGSLTKVHTFHKMMGFKKELLDDSLGADDFVARYAGAHPGSISAFRAFLSSPGPGALATGHSCGGRPRPGSCALCGASFARSRRARSEDAPPFLGANVLIVDEYGLMTDTLLERMLRVVALFYGPGRGPLIILAGSVSQLQPPGSAPRIWETPRLEELLRCSTPLFVNRRQFEDPGYAEALAYLQFNTVTEESRAVFRSQLLVSERDAMDPEHEPRKLRVFHRDDQVTAYTSAYLKKALEDAGTRAGDTFLSVRRSRASGRGPRAWYAVLQQVAQALPKLFAVPRYRGGGGASSLPTERDYLKTGKLWVGCKVRLIWHMDRNGIRLARDQTRAPWEDPPSARDTEGVVSGMSFKRETQAYEFRMRGERTGLLYKVGLSEWHCGDWTVTTHRLACMLAMNTYDCQGCTVSGEVLYHPPRWFAMSPIKPSVYVALSRVTRRDKLQLTNCNFAESGEVRFYDERLVAYRKRVEMNYSA